LWYDGTGVLVPDSGRSQIPPTNTGKGPAGRWGKKARKVFISRTLWMCDNPTHEIWTCIPTYRSNPDNPSKQLRAFIQHLRRLGMSNYCYTTELQPSTGNIHYHFAVDAPFPSGHRKKELNAAWERIRGDVSGNGLRDIRKLKSDSDFASYASKMAWYASKSSELRDKSPESIRALRLWATSSDLVGREKIAISDENSQIYMIVNAREGLHMTLQSGFEVEIKQFSREHTREIFALAEILNERDRVKVENSALKRREKQRKIEDLARQKKILFEVA